MLYFLPEPGRWWCFVRRMLVVDDNPADLFLIQEVLGGDYAIDVAEDSSGALQSLRNLGPSQEKPAIVMLDVDLPASSAADLVRAIRNDPQLTDVVVVTWTSSILRGEGAEFRKAGADEHIVKPMQLNEYDGIRRRLSELLARQRH
jgi:CheY-like chemotaxis protein